MIDTSLQLETPEGVTLHFKLAGFSARGLAWLLDFVIRVLSIFIFVIVCGFLFGDILPAIYLILYFFMEWLYPVYFEFFHQGQTPGKKRLHLRVINEDGTPIGLSASLIRNFLRTVDFFPIFYGIGLISSLIDKKFRRLGDLAAKSVVIYVDEHKNKVIKAQENAKSCPVWINQEEQKAILSYSIREKDLTTGRKKELAEILTPIHGKEGEEAIEEVQAYGSYIGGQS